MVLKIEKVEIGLLLMTIGAITLVLSWVFYPIIRYIGFIIAMIGISLILSKIIELMKQSW